MIKLLRVDDRVLHGQVAFSWLSKTNAKCILVASDKYASNPMLKMSLNIGKPPGVDLKILGNLCAQSGAACVVGSGFPQLF